MKTKLLRFTLVLFLCGITTVGKAQGDIIFEEHFDGIKDKNMGAYINIPLSHWSSYSNCSRSLNGTQNNPALKIERLDKDKGPEGYATTEALEYNGDVILSFSNGYTSGSTPTEAEIILTGNATFEANSQSSIRVNVNSHNTSMTRDYLYIRNLSETTTITFKTTSSIYYAIDDILVVKDILSENINNSSFISVHKNNITNVKTSRTLKGGIWNTLCLPFNVTKATMVAALGENQNIQMRTYTNYSQTDNAMNFDAVADDATIAAGTPFLIKINSDVINPTFESVTIVDTPAETVGENGSVQFVGTYDPINLNIDGTNLFITTSGSLAKPKDENSNHMKGLRAYITVPAGMNLARLTINDETTDIQQIALDKEKPTTLYSLNGQRLQTLKKGIIIRDGKLTFIK